MQEHYNTVYTTLPSDEHKVKGYKCCNQTQVQVTTFFKQLELN